jgi:hypothetical protein
LIVGDSENETEKAIDKLRDKNYIIYLKEYVFLHIM